MPLQPIKVLTEAAKSLEDLTNEIAKMQKILNYLLEGNLDFDNIRARGIKAENIEAESITANEIAADTITADKMNVDELSAITANLGTINVGTLIGVLIQAATIIGSYIATANGTYPRAEMSVGDNMFAVHLDANTRLVITPSGGLPNPAIKWTAFNGALNAMIHLYTTFENSLLIQSDGDVRFAVGGSVRFPSWSKVKSISPDQTLEAALNAKANVFAGYSGSVVAGANTLNFSNGILTSVT